MSKKRTLIQITFSVVSNAYYKGFLEGGIYKGNAKYACMPGLNCYSCPGALGSCPIGSVQAVLADKNDHFPLYAAGFITMFGAVFGRAVCGFMCPFGLIQDALDKIPFRHKVRKAYGDKYLRLLKYLVLILFVCLFPALIKNEFGSGDPWFCKYICPSGTIMAGWPLSILNEGIRAATGLLFAWKSLILILLVVLSVIIYRPFCRYLCPLGAIYGLFNKLSFYQYEIDPMKCTHCDACRNACKMDIHVYDDPNSRECIRCGECIRSCPETAISKRKLTFEDRKREVPDAKKI